MGDTEKHIVEEYQNGVGIAIIRYKYKLSYSVIYGILARAGIPMRYNANKLSKKMEGIDEQVAGRIIRDYREGVPLEVIYDRYSLHKNGLYTILDINQVPRRQLRKKRRSNPKEWMVG